MKKQDEKIKVVDLIGRYYDQSFVSTSSYALYMEIMNKIIEHITKPLSKDERVLELQNELDELEKQERECSDHFKSHFCEAIKTGSGDVFSKFSQEKYNEYADFETNYSQQIVSLHHKVNELEKKKYELKAILEGKNIFKKIGVKKQLESLKNEKIELVEQINELNTKLAKCKEWYTEEQELHATEQRICYLNETLSNVKTKQAKELAKNFFKKFPKYMAYDFEGTELALSGKSHRPVIDIDAEIVKAICLAQTSIEKEKFMKQQKELSEIIREELSK